MKRFVLCATCGVIIGGAATVVMADSPPKPPVPSDLDKLVDAPRPVGADSGDRLGSCKWEVNGFVNATELSVECEAGMAPIMGGCAQSVVGAELEQSSPFEEGSEDDPPDNGEPWYAVDGDVGWSCKYNTTGLTSVRALCCGAP